MKRFQQNRNRLQYIKRYFLVGLFVFQLFILPAQNVIPDTLVCTRIHRIQNALEQNKTKVNNWWYGWLGGYSIATIGQGAVYLVSDDKAMKQDMALGAITTMLGAIGQLSSPMNTGHQADLLRHIPESTPEERHEKLAVAERMFELLAKQQQEGKSLKTHILYTGVNTTCGLITWLGFKRTIWAGIGNFALNTAVTELQIRTQPSRLMKDYQEYCREYNSEVSQHSHQTTPTLYVSAYPGGIAIRILF